MDQGQGQEAANNGNNANGPKPQQEQESAQAANNVNNANAPRPQRRPPVSKKTLIIIIAIVASVILLVIIVSLILVFVVFKKAADKPLETPFSEAEKKEFVDAHNKYRGMVNPPAKDMKPMVWDNDIAKYAQEWADNCKFGPGKTKSYIGKMGQNIFSTTQLKDVGTSAVKVWGSESTDYDYNKNSCASGRSCGHYLQVVWAKSTKLGCGRSKEGCLKGGYNYKYPKTIIVCNYFPAGNVDGEKPYKA